VRKQKYLHDIEIQFESPVAKWEKPEWKAVATIALDKLFTLTDKHSSYVEISDEMFKEIKQLRKSYRLGGSTKKGKIYEPKNSIRKICKEISSTKFEDVLEALMDAELCIDWYESTSDPIGVLFTGVDDSTKVISYLSRGALPDEQKQIKFGTLRNILSKINK